MQRMFSLILLLLCGSSFTAGNGSSLRNIKACVSFDKNHMSHLNIGWDGSNTEVEITYKTTGTNETSVKYESVERMIFGLKVNNGSIGSNVTVQLAPVINDVAHKDNKSDPMTIAVNYIYDVKWTRLSANHIQFNCTLACRSAINSCVVELNATMNTSLGIIKEDFSSWAVVDFYSVDADEAFLYTVYAQDNNNNLLGQRMNGHIPPLSTVVENTISPTTKSEEASTVFILATSSQYMTTASSSFTQGNVQSTTMTTVVHTKAVDVENENNSSTGLMIGVIITSLLVILLASILLAVAVLLWRQKRGKTLEVSSKHITDAKHDMQNASLHGTGQTIIKEKNVIAINAYEEIVEVPVYSKPLSTPNPLFIQTGRVKHSSISSKKSVSSQKSFENLQENLSPPVFDEKSGQNKNFEDESFNNESHNHSSNENKIDHCSESNNKIQMNFNSETENSDQESPALTENDTEEKENPYFELVNLATTNFYENTTILPLSKQTNKNTECKTENVRNLEKVCSKCQTLPVQGLRNSKSQPLDELNIKRRSLNDYDEPVKVDQIIDPTTGHTYTLPILRKKE